METVLEHKKVTTPEEAKENAITQKRIGKGKGKERECR